MKQHNLLFSIIVFAMVTRLSIPFVFGHLPNFSALDALALFCGAYCERRIIAIALCIGSVWLSDILLTHTLFYPGFYWQYASYGLIVLIGRTLGQRSKWIPAYAGMTETTKMPGAAGMTETGGMTTAAGGMTASAMMALTSASLFFVVSNFGVWFSSSMYPHTLDGLIACYIAAIPFFKNTLVSDVVFTSVLFGTMSLCLQKRGAVLERRQP